MPRKQVGAIDSALLDRVDTARGDVPRTKFVERALEEALGSSESTRQPAETSSVGRSTPASPRASEMTPVRELVDEANSVKEQKLAVLREQMANVTGDDFDLVAAGQREPAPVCDACGDDAVKKTDAQARDVWVCPTCHGLVKR